jgi:hypothetical protein
VNTQNVISLKEEGDDYTGGGGGSIEVSGQFVGRPTVGLDCEGFPSCARHKHKPESLVRDTPVYYPKDGRGSQVPCVGDSIYYEYPKGRSLVQPP